MSGKQLGFSHNELTMAKNQIKRHHFFPEIEVVVPWLAQIGLADLKVSKKAADLPICWAPCC